MQPKFICLVILLIALVFVEIEADSKWATNRGLDFEPMKPEEINKRGLKCVPGRTVVRMEEKQEAPPPDSGDEDEDYRRSHMNWKGDNKERCQICTCSLEGKDEHCSRRPAKNVNECLVLARLAEELNSNVPFDHQRELSNLIRRRFGVQKGLKGPACIPYISEYNDCSEYTTCRGCNQCRCNEQAQWICFKKRNTCSDLGNEMELYDDGTEDNAIGKILQELAQKEREEKTRKLPTHIAPFPEKRKKTADAPLGYIIAILR